VTDQRGRGPLPGFLAHREAVGRPLSRRRSHARPIVAAEVVQLAAGIGSAAVTSIFFYAATTSPDYAIKVSLIVVLSQDASRD
jgi:hypothetical protein